MKSKESWLHGKIFHVHGQEQSISPGWPSFPTSSVNSMQSQSKPGTLFVDVDKTILKFTRRGKRLRVANTVLEEREYRGQRGRAGAAGLTLLAKPR